MITVAVHGKQQYDKECVFIVLERLILAKHPVLLEYLGSGICHQIFKNAKESITDDSKKHIRDEKEKVEDLLGDMHRMARCYLICRERMHNL